MSLNYRQRPKFRYGLESCSIFPHVPNDRVLVRGWLNILTYFIWSHRKKNKYVIIIKFNQAPYKIHVHSLWGNDSWVSEYEWFFWDHRTTANLKHSYFYRSWKCLVSFKRGVFWAWKSVWQCTSFFKIWMMTEWLNGCCNNYWHTTTIETNHFNSSQGCILLNETLFNYFCKVLL